MLNEAVTVPTFKQVRFRFHKVKSYGSYGSGSSSTTLLQGFGSGTAWIRNNLSCWIRIRIQIADPDPGGQKLLTKIDKSPEFSCF